LFSVLQFRPQAGFEFKLAYWQNASSNLILLVKITLAGIYLQVTVHLGRLHIVIFCADDDAWQLPAAETDDVFCARFSN
jgi:hypothetical protein